MSIQASRTVVVVVVLAAIAGVFWYMKRDASTLRITSYDECVSAGYTLVATNPPQCLTPEGVTFTQIVATSTAATSTATSTAGTSTPTDNRDLIRVSNITANQKITSPLTIQGQARGAWYFEATFPVKILDGDGNPIAQMPAQAQGEWMTSEFVPFKVTLMFPKPATATGTIILHNDNPSGMPEKDRFISIPVRF